MIDFQKVAEAIERSSPEIRNLMFSAEFSDKIWKIIELNNIKDEEIAFKIIDEVGYVILDLKPRHLFYDALNKLGIDIDITKKISKDMEASIFVKLDQIKNLKKETPSETSKNQSNVGNSFEQIVLNQARAMKEAVPTNLPIAKEPQIQASNYSSSNDPYREPLG